MTLFHLRRLVRFGTALGRSAGSVGKATPRRTLRIEPTLAPIAIATASRSLLRLRRMASAPRARSAVNFSLGDELPQ